jgi:hypothetical protein
MKLTYFNYLFSKEISAKDIPDRSMDTANRLMLSLDEICERRFGGDTQNPNLAAEVQFTEDNPILRREYLVGGVRVFTVVDLTLGRYSSDVSYEESCKNDALLAALQEFYGQSPEPVVHKRSTSK